MREGWKIAIVIGIAVMLSSVVLIYSSPSVRATDYTFGSQNVTKGHSANEANRDLEDGNYQTLAEADQYTNTNFSGSSEDMTYGTAGGGAFPGSLDTDDETRRTYTEENTGGSPPASYILYLYPDGDYSVNWDTVYPSGNHYAQVDETTIDSDEGATYLETGTNNDRDVFTFADMSDPGAGYELDVKVFGVHYKGASQPCDFRAGIWNGGASTYYPMVTENPSNGVYTNTTSEWAYTLNPYTSSEWTYMDICNLYVWIGTNDASPAVRCSQVGVMVYVNFSAAENYELDGTITFSSVGNTSQTTGFTVLCQGYRGDTEDFGVYAWSYAATGWNLKTTVQAGSDTDYDFDLTWAEYDDVGEEVKIRFVGLTETGDTIQSILYFDVLKVCRVEEGYALDVDMTASSLPEFGNLQLRVKGYTSSEQFDVSIYNWTLDGWDADKIAVTALSNTLYTYNLIEEHHRSDTETVKIRFEDADAYTSDQVQDILYLDAVLLGTVHTDPTITLYGDDGPVNVGSTAHFWLNYTDEDNEAPEYVRVVIDSTPYDMAKNETDTSYWDGCNYSLSKSDLTGGTHPYYFAVKDANSDEVTTSEDSIVINRAPTLTLDGVTPVTGNNGQTFYFYVNYTDLDNNAPDYIQVVIGETPYDMTKNETDPEDNSYDNGVNYTYSKAMAGGSHSYYFQTADYLSSQVQSTPKQLDVNNPPVLSDYSRWPSDPCYPTTQVYFNVTFTDADGDLPSAIKWRESEGTIQNITMTATVPEDDDTTDGKLYYCAVYLSHGGHDYDFYAEDALSSTSGGDNSITIQNRDPIISNGPGTDPNEYRNTAWNYDFDGSDPDEDTIGWEVSGPVWLTINPSSGYLSGTTPDAVGNYGFTVYCNDSYGGSDNYAFTLHVVNRVPVIDSSGNTTQALDTFMCYHVLYHDDDSDEVTLEFASNATWLSLENEYVNGTATPVGWYWCKVWANDSYGGSDLEEWDVTVTFYENQPPYFTVEGVTTISNNTFYSFLASASDPEEDELTWDLEGNGTVFLAIHSTLGYVNGTPTELGWWYVNVSVTDEVSVVWLNFTLTSFNEAPYFTSSPILTGTNGTAYYYNANAVDNNSDVLRYYLAEGDPAWLFVDEDTGEVEGTPTLAGEYDVHLYVVDSEDAITWQNWTLTINQVSAPQTPSERLTNDLIVCLPGAIVMMTMAFAIIYVYLYIRSPPRPQKRDRARKGGKNDGDG